MGKAVQSGAARRQRLAAVVGAVVIAAGLVGVAAPTTMAAIPAGDGSTSTKEGNGPKDDHPHDSDPFESPKCDSSGYDHDHDDTCDGQPSPEPTPTSAPAPNREPDPPYVPGYLWPLVVAPVEAATIFTGQIDCGDMAVEPSSVDSAGVRVKRLDDAYGSGCQPADYVINAAEKGVQFLKNGSPYAQFVMAITWRSELEIPQTSMTYADFELVEGGYELAMPRCPASLYKNGKLVGLPSLDDITPASLLTYGITDMDGMPGTKTTADNGISQYACVGDRHNKFVDYGDDPHYELTQDMYILGDIYIRR